MKVVNKINWLLTYALISWIHIKKMGDCKIFRYVLKMFRLAYISPSSKCSGTAYEGGIPCHCFPSLLHSASYTQAAKESTAFMHRCLHLTEILYV